MEEAKNLPEDTEIDLFDTPDLIPKDVLAIFEDFEPTYDRCEKALKACKALGYTFEYYLNAEPYNLRKINK